MKKAEKEMLRAEFSKVWGKDQHMIDYCTNKVSTFARLENGEIWTIDKPPIKTRFHFGYSLNHYDTDDYDNAQRMADYAEKSVKYFIAENFKHSEFDGWIESLSDDRHTWYVQENYTRQSADCKLVAVNHNYPYYITDIPKGTRLLTEKEKVAMIEALTEAKQAFEKRLNAYLKKYGLSKIETTTYWQDE